MKLNYQLLIFLFVYGLTTSSRLKLKTTSRLDKREPLGITVLSVFSSILRVPTSIYQGFSLEERKKAEETHLMKLERISSFFAGSFAEMCSRVTMSEILNNEIYHKFNFEVRRVELAGRKILTTVLTDNLKQGLSKEETDLLDFTGSSLWEQISSIRESMQPLVYASRAAVDSICYFRDDSTQKLKESSLRRISAIQEEIAELSFFVKMILNPAEYRDKWFNSLKDSIASEKEILSSKPQISLKDRLIAVTNMILTAAGLRKELVSSGIEALKAIYSKIVAKNEDSPSEIVPKILEFLKEVNIAVGKALKVPEKIQKIAQTFLEIVSSEKKQDLQAISIEFLISIGEENSEDIAKLREIATKIKETVKTKAGKKSNTELKELLTVYKLPEEESAFLNQVVSSINNKEHWKNVELGLSLVKLITKRFKLKSSALSFLLKIAEMSLVLKKKGKKEAFKLFLITLGDKIKEILVQNVKAELKKSLEGLVSKLIKPLKDIYSSISKIYVAHYNLVNTKRNINQSEKQLSNMLSKAKNKHSFTVTALNFDSISNYSSLKEGTKLLFSFKRVSGKQIEADEHCAKNFLYCFSLIGRRALSSLKREDKRYCPKGVFIGGNKEWEESLLSAGFEKSSSHNIYYNFFYSSSDLEVLDLYFTEEKAEEARTSWISNRKLSNLKESQLILKQFKLDSKKVFAISIKSAVLDTLPSLRESFCRDFNVKFGEETKKPVLKRSNSLKLQDKKALSPSSNYSQDELEHILLKEMCSLVDKSLSSFTSKQLEAISLKDKEISKKHGTAGEKEKMSISELTDQIKVDEHFSLTRIDLALISRGKQPIIDDSHSSEEKQEITFKSPNKLSEGLFFSYINSKEPECLLARELVARNRIYTVHSKHSADPDKRKGTEKERNEFNLLKENAGIWTENSLKAKKLKNIVEIEEFLENGLLTLIDTNDLRYSPRQSKENKDLDLNNCRYSIQFVTFNTGEKGALRYELGHREKYLSNKTGNKSVSLTYFTPFIRYRAVPEESKERGYKPEIKFMITTQSPNLTEKDKEELRLARNGALLKAANFGWTKLDSIKTKRFDISEPSYVIFDKNSGELRLDVLVRPLPLKSEEDPKQLCDNITKKS